MVAASQSAPKSATPPRRACQAWALDPYAGGFRIVTAAEQAEHLGGGDALEHDDQGSPPHEADGRAELRAQAALEPVKFLGKPGFRRAADDLEGPVRVEVHGPGGQRRGLRAGLAPVQRLEELVLQSDAGLFAGPGGLGVAVNGRAGQNAQPRPQQVHQASEMPRPDGIFCPRSDKQHVP